MEQKGKKRAAPPRYDDDFKAGAIQLVTEQHLPCGNVASEFGICIDTLRSWLKAAGIQAGQTDRQNRDGRRLRELEAENRALRKQISEKDEVIDVLKKSVGILSKP
ncbi:MAG: transposase [Ethanoligenens sp.]